MSKFSCPLAKELYDCTLESFQDDETGDAVSGSGWYALFRKERAILVTDPQGFVSVSVYESDTELEKVWKKAVHESLYGHLDTSCNGLFLILDTARHLGDEADYEEVSDHVEKCETCRKLGNFLDA